MYVCTPYVIKFPDYLNEFSTDSIGITGKHSSNNTDLVKNIKKNRFWSVMLEKLSLS